MPGHRSTSSIGAAKKVDAFQQRHGPLAFVLAVIEEVRRRPGANLAALLTYYGFLSLFPLLLVLVTVLGYVLQGNPSLQRRHRRLGGRRDPDHRRPDPQQRRVGAAATAIGLAIGILVTFYGGLGVANAAQDAMNRVWEVPMRVAAGFLPRLAAQPRVDRHARRRRSSSRPFSAASARRTASLGACVRIAAFLGGVALNIGLFAVAFRVLTARDVGVARSAAGCGHGRDRLGDAPGDRRRVFVSHQLRG